METTTLIAVISSVTSVIIALVSFFSSRNTSKKSESTALKIETLKFELARKKHLNDLSKTTLENKIKAIDKLITEIQQIKDIILLIVAAFDKSMSAKIAIDHIKKTRELYFESFQTESAILDKDEQKPAHRAKVRLVTLELTVLKFLKDKVYVELEEYQKNELTDIRNELTDLQNLSRDVKYQLYKSLLDETN